MIKAEVNVGLGTLDVLANLHWKHSKLISKLLDDSIFETGLGKVIEISFRQHQVCVVVQADYRLTCEDINKMMEVYKVKERFNADYELPHNNGEEEFISYRFEGELFHFHHQYNNFIGCRNLVFEFPIKNEVDHE